MACNQETDLGGWRYRNPQYIGGTPLVQLSPAITWKGDHVPTEPVAPGVTVGKGQSDNMLSFTLCF